jgi:GNAT superfamily N-acetyltransferase
MSAVLSIRPPGPAASVDTVRLAPDIALTIRPLGWPDAEPLKAHVRGLSMRSRHNRYLGGLNEISQAEVARIIGDGTGPVFGFLAETTVDGTAVMVAEAVLALDHTAGTAEFALSVADAWQGRGIGAALVASIECRAASAGAALVHGETLRGNEAMLALAAKTGFAVTQHRGDTRLIRIEKAVVGAVETPCSRLGSMSLPLAA